MKPTNSTTCGCLVFCWVAVVLGGLVGCGSSPSRIDQAGIDVSAATEAVFGKYDADGGGTLSTQELESLPSVGGSLSYYDRDGDNQISPDEFRKHLETMFDRRGALLSATCVVKRGGQPLVGAKVRFVPEDFLADMIPEASGIVRNDGTATLGVAAENMPAGAPNARDLMRPGIYRVEITHDSKEIPARYNRDSKLGQEVSGDTVRAGPFHFSL